MTSFLKRFLSFIHIARGGRRLQVDLPVAALLIACGLLAACHKNDEPTPPNNQRQVKTSLLLYAVASNNLSSAFDADLEEIRRGAASANLDVADIVIYSVSKTEQPTLRRAVKNDDGSIGFRVIKSYDRSRFSTDPAVISEVIGDYLKLSEADSHGLILWSHATGWQPDYPTHEMPTIMRSFGADQVFDPETNKVITTDYCDLLELSSAIPDGIFKYIWFDCCYMGAIEVVYELRNKADYFVASAMELAGEGMPYHLTIPFLAKENPTLLGAIDAETGYYRQHSYPYTFALIDASRLEELASLTRAAMHGTQPNEFTLKNYARGQVCPAYDFGQYVRLTGANLPADSPYLSTWSEEKFAALMDDVVIFKAASEKDWRNLAIPEDAFSGLTIHYYADYSDADTDYYRSLSWFKSAYPAE